MKHTYLEFAGTVTPEGKRTIYPVFSLEGTKIIGDREESDVLMVPASDEILLPTVNTPMRMPTNLPGTTPKTLSEE
ncbi:hypothetical protein D3C78_1871980 [compost metagenome]